MQGGGWDGVATLLFYAFDPAAVAPPGPLPVVAPGMDDEAVGTQLVPAPHLSVIVACLEQRPLAPPLPPSS